ncbi:hypothetical protein Pan97_41680 [Bremerella volcania]|uniref:EF-hand domain-containing protein n=1 Tax=Bremerella volcania TaxID=2527984 RepID=A0A518CD11_9BACT|nr:dockerin type I domain-containing protein [Bremerella volcania]QDU77106.1 hypothetical protein Pan97_41680 [Bremerella volcania]
MHQTVEVLEVRVVMDNAGLDFAFDGTTDLVSTKDQVPAGFLNHFVAHTTDTKHGRFELAIRPDNVQLWIQHLSGDHPTGESEKIFEWQNYRPGNTNWLFAPMPKDNHSLYIELINPNGETEFWAYRFETGAIELTSGLPEHLRPPVSEPIKLTPIILPPLDLRDAIRIPDIVLAYGLDHFSPRWKLGKAIVDFKLSREPLPELGSINNGVMNETVAGTNNSFTEWENVTGGLWVTVGKEMQEGPVDLTWIIKGNHKWLNDPAITQALGESFEIKTTKEDGIRVSTAKLKGLDLSQYSVGERVLIAKVLFTPNANDPVGIPIPERGYHPDPIGELVIRLESASIGESAEVAVSVSPYVPAKFYAVIYDTNDDGKVNHRDLVAFLTHFGKKGLSAYGEDAYRYDFNHDDKVNLADFRLLIQHFGSQKLTQRQETSVSTSPFVDEEPKTVVIGSQLDQWNYYLVTESLVSELEAELESTSIEGELHWIADCGEPLDIAWPLPWNNPIDDRILAALEAGYRHGAGDLSFLVGDEDGEVTST